MRLEAGPNNNGWAATFNPIRGKCKRALAHCELTCTKDAPSRESFLDSSDTFLRPSQLTHPLVLCGSTALLDMRLLPGGGHRIKAGERTQMPIGLARDSLLLEDVKPS